MKKTKPTRLCQFLIHAIAALALLAPVSALADVVYTTLPGSAFSSGAAGLGDTRYAGFAFRTPAGQPYAIDSVRLNLWNNTNVPDPQFVVGLYDDSAGDPGSLVAVIGTGLIDPTFDVLEVATPASPVLLAADTVYWIMTNSPGNGIASVGWFGGGGSHAGSTFPHVRGPVLWTPSSVLTDVTAIGNLHVEINASLAVVDTATLTLVKVVTNDDAGAAGPGDFTLTATGPVDTVTGAGGSAAVTSQVVEAGDYVLSESVVAGYTQENLDCTGATLNGDTVTLAKDDVATCTFTNNDDPVVVDAALTLVKVSSVSTYSNVNDVIDYSYQVTASNAAVAGPITVTDDRVTVTCPAVNTVGNNDDNLDPAESVTCTASHTVVQADIDAGTITNTATAAGEAGATVSNEDMVTVNYLAPTYSVGGNVSGLTGAGLTLQNNGADDLPIAADGPFTFSTELIDATAYAVTVSAQPTGQTCNVTNGNDSVAAADVTDVAVACVDDVAPPVVPPSPAVPIPTLSQWALITLSMFLGLMVFSNRKRLF